MNNKLVPQFKTNFFSLFSGLNLQKYKVLEMDRNGTIYLYRSSLLCVNEIIKRLSEGKYQLAEPSMLGKTGLKHMQSIKNLSLYVKMKIFNLQS